MTPPTRGRAVLVHPNAELYGADRMFLESVVAFVEDGWDVTVAMPERGPLVERVEAAGARFELCPTPVLRKGLLGARGLLTLAREALTGIRAGRRLLDRARPSVVYVSTVTIPLWVVLARLRRVPVLCHVHEAERSVPRVLRDALALPLNLADVVLANSQFAVDVVLGSFRRLAPRVRLLSNGVVGPPEPERAREHLVGPVRLVYVGRLSARKGVDVAVDALGVLRERGVDAHLDVVGAVYPGYEWYLDELTGRIASSGLEDWVTLHGFQDPVWGYLAAADVALVPSRTDEPFGNTAVEAVLAARPVVATVTGGLLEATAGYRSAQTVRPDDPAAVADAVQRVVRDWSGFADDAWADAARAAERHAPAAYRAAVAQAARRVVQGRAARP